MYSIRGKTGGTILSSTMLLAGCGGTPYLDAPVPPEKVTSSPAFDGSWGGVVEPLYRQRILNSARSFGKAIVCEAYSDSITLKVEQGTVNIKVGSEPVYELVAQLDDDGYFYQRIATDSYRQKTTELWVTGQVSASQAQTKGQVGYGPAGIYQGCMGSFVATRNGGSDLPAAELPFTIDYYFVNVRERH